MNGDNTSLRNDINYKSQSGCLFTQKTRVPDDDRTFYLIQDFITQKKVKKAGVLAPDILLLLVEQNIIIRRNNSESSNHKNDYKAALNTDCLIVIKSLHCYIQPI